MNVEYFNVSEKNKQCLNTIKLIELISSAGKSFAKSIDKSIKVIGSPEEGCQADIIKFDLVIHREYPNVINIFNIKVKDGYFEIVTSDKIIDVSDIDKIGSSITNVISEFDIEEIYESFDIKIEQEESDGILELTNYIPNNRNIPLLNRRISEDNNIDNKKFPPFEKKRGYRDHHLPAASAYSMRAILKLSKFLENNEVKKDFRKPYNTPKVEMKTSHNHLKFKFKQGENS